MHVSPIHEINHTFMTTGHSYLPNDKDFGVFELAITRTSELYVPEQWCSVVRNCNHTNPFTVNNMSQDKFVSVGDMLKKFKTIRKMTDDSKKLNDSR